MAGLTLSTADAALKDFYLPGAREQLNNDVPILNYVEKNTQDIEGRQAVLAIHGNRSAGVGARAELGTLPTVSNQGYAQEKVALKFNYGHGQISGQTIKAMASDRGSFVRALDSEMKGITADLKRDVNRQLWGNADGKIATCGTTTASTTVTLAAATTTTQTRQLEVGMKVDIGTVAAPTTVVSGATITAANPTASPPTITIDSSVTTSSSHFIFRSGSVGANTCAEVTGLQKIVASSGTLHNVDPTTTAGATWVSTVDSNSGTLRSISENLLAKNVQSVQIAGGAWPNLLVASDGGHRAFSALLTSLKRFPQTTQLKGGYSSIDFTAAGPTIPFVFDRDCPYNSVFTLNTDHLIEFQMSDWEFMQEDGHVLFRVSGVDAYEFTLFKYHELATDKRNSHGVVQDVTTA